MRRPRFVEPSGACSQVAPLHSPLSDTTGGRLPPDEAEKRWCGTSWHGFKNEPDSRTKRQPSGADRTPCVFFRRLTSSSSLSLLGPLRHLDPDRASSIAGKLSRSCRRSRNNSPTDRNRWTRPTRAETARRFPREPVEQPYYIAVGRRLMPIAGGDSYRVRGRLLRVALSMYAARQRS